MNTDNNLWNVRSRRLFRAGMLWFLRELACSPYGGFCIAKLSLKRNTQGKVLPLAERGGRCEKRLMWWKTWHSVPHGFKIHLYTDKNILGFNFMFIHWSFLACPKFRSLTYYFASRVHNFLSLYIWILVDTVKLCLLPSYFNNISYIRQLYEILTTIYGHSPVYHLKGDLMNMEKIRFKFVFLFKHFTTDFQTSNI